jgi:transcriptional regulator with XRE-family HTH domain
VDDIQLGTALRAVRLRHGWTQDRVATASGTSATVVSRIERGRVEAVSLPALRRIAVTLDVRLDIVPRWRGGELYRMLNRRHARLEEAFSAHLHTIPGWTLRPEVSFSILGERGVIDVLGWYPARAMLLIVELKTELVDVMDLMATMDRRRRLGTRIAADLGWQPVAVSSLVLLAESRTNRRRLADHRTVLRAAFPADGRRLASWLADPREAIALLTLWPEAPSRRG